KALVDGERKTILVMHPDEEQRQQLLELLRNDKIELREASGPDDAAVLLDGGTIDCAIVEIRSESEQSLDWVREIKGGAASDDTLPVIAHVDRSVGKEVCRELRRLCDTVVSNEDDSSAWLLDRTVRLLHLKEEELTDEQR